MTQYTSLLATSLATAVLALSALAPATATDRFTVANAPGRCQAALPAFEGQIRKRPLAVQNEGTAPAFVTCSLIADGSDFTTTQSISIWAANTGSADATLQCTAVVGYEQGEVTYVSKSVGLVAGGVQGQIFFGPTEFPAGFAPGEPVSLSCNVPVGVGLNDMYLSYDDGYAPPAAPAMTAR